MAQTNYHTQVVDIILSGTSNLHDWEIKAVSGTSDATVVVYDSKITSLSKMNFSFPVKNLKSGHGAMDKNTYKAMNTALNPNISFVLTSATIIAAGGNNYKLNCKEKMTIAGTTNETELLATGIYNPADKSFTVTGIKKSCLNILAVFFYTDIHEANAQPGKIVKWVVEKNSILCVQDKSIENSFT